MLSCLKQTVPARGERPEIEVADSLAVAENTLARVQNAGTSKATGEEQVGICFEADSGLQQISLVYSLPSDEPE